MVEVLIIFGSKSDAPIYQQIVGHLEAKNISFELRICSAHRTPQELKKILQDTDAKVIIAGAGLSAALPGVVASETVTPVIGVPVAGNYSGLDALLSIAQMPPGIPVMAVGVEEASEAASNAEKLLRKKIDVVLVGGHGKPLEKAKAMLNKFNVSFGVKDAVEDFDPETIYLQFIGLSQIKGLKKRSALTIYIPVADGAKAEDALSLMNSKEGLWVGLNRGDNAALSAIEILALGNPLREALEAHRQEMREKVLKDDEAERKKVEE